MNYKKITKQTNIYQEITCQVLSENILQILFTLSYFEIKTRENSAVIDKKHLLVCIMNHLVTLVNK